MRDGLCHREIDVVRAHFSGELAAELRSHLEGCPACRQALAVAGHLAALAAASPLPSNLPEARQLWLKAQVIRRLVEQGRRQERADRPAFLGRWLGLGGAAAGTLAYFTWQGAAALGGSLPSPGAGAAALGFAAAALALLLALLAVGLLWRPA